MKQRARKLVIGFTALALAGGGLLASTIASAPAAAAAEVVVSAVDFEDGTTGSWTQSGGGAGTLAVVDADGGKVLQVTDRNADYVGLQSPTGLFEEGTEYTFSMRVRLAEGTPGTGVRFVVKDGFHWVGNTNVTADAWTTVTGTRVADADDTQVYIGTNDIGGVSAYTYFVDDILITAPDDSGGPGPEPGTVVVESDFDDGTLQGWTVRNGASDSAPVLSVVTPGVNDSEGAAQVADRTSTGDGLQYSVTGLVESGATYAFEAWIRYTTSQPGGEASDLTLSAILPGASNEFPNLIQIPGVTDQWTKVGGEFTFPSHPGTASIYFETRFNRGNLSTFQIDDIKVWVPEPPVVQLDLEPLKDTVDFPVGVAIDSRETTGQPSVLLQHHFNQITPENHMKVEAWYDADRNFRMHPEAVALLDYAQANDLPLYGHVLLWHSQTPAWFFTDDTGRPLEDTPADRQFLQDRLATHIDSIAKAISDEYGLFGSDTNPLVAWDVVNEVVSDADTDDGLRRSAWYTVFGEDYIPLAFELADEAFNGTYAVADSVSERPVTLFINDYNTEQGGKQDRYFALVQRLLADGVPVDGVGHQFHVSVTTPIPSLKSALDRFVPLDVVQAVTEMDVTIGTPVTTANLIRQGHYYRDAFRLFRTHQAAADDLFSVTIWGLTDNRSWRAAQVPLLFDAGLQAKQAYHGAVDSDELEPLLTAANVFGGEVSTASDAADWRNLPAQQLTSEAGSFIPRWTPEHLTLLVTVASDSSDAIEIQYGSSTYRVGSDGSGDATSAQVFDDPGGWRALVQLAHSGVVVGNQAQLDVRVLSGSSVVGAWNSPGATGTLTFLEDLSTVDVKPAGAVPVIDGSIDAVWQEANTVGTGKTVEGNAAGATADVRTLWADDTLYVLYEVTDPVIDVSGSDPWVQDSVELFLDVGNAKNGSYRAEDAQLRISATNAQSFGTGDQAAQAARLTSATATSPDGYVVELAVTLLGQGGADTFQGLDFQVNDGREGSRYSVHTWAEPTGTGYQTTARWGVGHLVTAEPSGPTPPDEADLVEGARGSVQAPPAARQGETIQLVVGAAHAGQDVRVWLFSEPVLLLEGVVSASGKVSVQIPAATPPGVHKLAVTNLSDELLGWDDLVIGAADAAAVNLVPPSIVGKARVGETVKANPGSWWPAKVKLAYQWALDGRPVRKATDAWYRIQSGDVSKALTVTVTASAKGYVPVSATSAPVTATQKAIVNKSLPRVSGKAVVGAKVTAKPGTWSPAKVRLAYQWNLNGVAIPKATKSSYTVRSGDLGKSLSVTVTASAKGYASASATSPPVTVTQKSVANLKAPSVAGKASEGMIVTADPGKWDPKGAKYAYQWRSNGTPVPGATKQSYKIQGKDVGAQLSVTVTASAHGYLPLSVTSKAVKVQPKPGKR